MVKAKYYPVGDNEKIGFEIVIQVKGEGQVPASSGFAMGICLIQATYSGWLSMWCQNFSRHSIQDRRNTIATSHQKRQLPPAALRRELVLSVLLITLCGMKEEARPRVRHADNTPLHTVLRLCSSSRDN